MIKEYFKLTLLMVKSPTEVLQSNKYMSKGKLFWFIMFELALGIVATYFYAVEMYYSQIDAITKLKVAALYTLGMVVATIIPMIFLFIFAKKDISILTGFVLAAMPSVIINLFVAVVFIFDQNLPLYIQSVSVLVWLVLCFKVIKMHIKNIVLQFVIILVCAFGVICAFCITMFLICSIKEIVEIIADLLNIPGPIPSLSDDYLL